MGKIRSRLSVWPVHPTGSSEVRHRGVHGELMRSHSCTQQIYELGIFECLRHVEKVTLVCVLCSVPWYTG